MTTVEAGEIWHRMKHLHLLALSCLRKLGMLRLPEKHVNSKVTATHPLGAMKILILSTSNEQHILCLLPRGAPPVLVSINVRNIT